MLKWQYSEIPDAYRELQRALYQARRTIIDLMPEPVSQALRSYYSCDSREDATDWERATTEKIIELAEVLAPEAGSRWGPRAYCPLCKLGSQSPYEAGFSLPEGLRRHLVGFGNTHQCAVMQTAFELARDHWNEKFRPSEMAADTAKRALTAQRRKSETLYRVSPDREAELIDENIWLGQARSETDLGWAEKRLEDLGFSIVNEANVKAYVRDYEKYAVYADPRRSGEISFTVYKKPLPHAAKRNQPRLSALNHFELRDNWKHELTGKYESRLAQAAARALA